MPFLDRIGAPFTSTFRPQEAFSTQTLDAAVRALNREKPQAVFVTGDITDNAQRNELDAGARTRSTADRHPDSGARATTACRTPTPPTPSTTAPTTTRPPTPARSRRPSSRSTPQGLKAPWYPLVGNHDVLAQGEVPPTPEINAFATGDRLVPSLDPRPARAADATRSAPSRPSTRCSPASSRSTPSARPPTATAA